MWTNAERAIRALRLRRGWSQEELGKRVGVSRELVSRAERGKLRGMTLATIARIAEELGASVHLAIRWRGEQLDRLLDAAHASLEQATAAFLVALGWEIHAEVSFNHFGDRGRIDLLAYHPWLHILLVIEIKSAIGDLQETLGRLDIKVRLARNVARDLGWTDVTAVVRVLVIGDSRRARAVVAEHDALFARFGARGRAALAWVRSPSEPIPTGLLWFTKRSDSHQVTSRRVRRVPKPPDSHQA